MLVARMLTLAFVLSLLGSAACHDRTDETPNITRDQARSLVLGRYRQLFSDKFLLNPLSNKHYPWPPLSERDFDSIEESPNYWSVRADPETGVTVDARVDKKGQWIELLRVSAVYQ